MNIVLCGMMGSGKSTVGKEVAAITGKTFMDTDEVIVERHGKIADIFREFGEGYFRDLESGLVKEISQREGLVLSTGGGLVLRKENVDLLRQKGKIFFLRASIETLLGRLKKDGERPLLEGEEELRSRLDRLLQARTSIYEAAADDIVDTDGKTPKEIATEIARKAK